MVSSTMTAAVHLPNPHLLLLHILAVSDVQLCSSLRLRPMYVVDTSHFSTSSFMLCIFISHIYRALRGHSSHPFVISYAYADWEVTDVDEAAQRTRPGAAGSPQAYACVRGSALATTNEYIPSISLLPTTSTASLQSSDTLFPHSLVHLYILNHFRTRNTQKRG